MKTLKILKDHDDRINRARMVSYRSGTVVDVDNTTADRLLAAEVAEEHTPAKTAPADAKAGTVKAENVKG